MPCISVDGPVISMICWNCDHILYNLGGTSCKSSTPISFFFMIIVPVLLHNYCSRRDYVRIGYTGQQNLLSTHPSTIQDDVEYCKVGILLLSLGGIR
jgi:hypothetical protein